MEFKLCDEFSVWSFGVLIIPAETVEHIDNGFEVAMGWDQVFKVSVPYL